MKLRGLFLVAADRNGWHPGPPAGSSAGPSGPPAARPPRRPLRFAATVVTGALSVGAYCLTSDGGDTRALQQGVQRWTDAPQDAAPPAD